MSDSDRHGPCRPTKSLNIDHSMGLVPARPERRPGDRDAHAHLGAAGGWLRDGADAGPLLSAVASGLLRGWPARDADRLWRGARTAPPAGRASGGTCRETQSGQELLSLKG